MEKILKPIAAVILLGAVMFLAGEWPETAERNQVILCDGGALLTALVCGLYLKRKEGRK